jgi:hypothetical protein
MRNKSRNTYNSDLSDEECVKIKKEHIHVYNGKYKNKRNITNILPKRSPYALIYQIYSTKGRAYVGQTTRVDSDNYVGSPNSKEGIKFKKDCKNNKYVREILEYIYSDNREIIRKKEIKWKKKRFVLDPRTGGINIRLDDTFALNNLMDDPNIVAKKVKSFKKSIKKFDESPRGKRIRKLAAKKALKTRMYRHKKFGLTERQKDGYKKMIKTRKLRIKKFGLTEKEKNAGKKISKIREKFAKTVKGKKCYIKCGIKQSKTKRKLFNSKRGDELRKLASKNQKQYNKTEKGKRDIKRRINKAKKINRKEIVCKHRKTGKIYYSKSKREFCKIFSISQTAADKALKGIEVKTNNRSKKAVILNDYVIRYVKAA